MPSDDRGRLALDALKDGIATFQSTVAVTAAEVRSYLASRQSSWDSVIKQVADELGPLAAGRIDPERFASVVVAREAVDPAALAVVDRALETLTSVAARAGELCRVDVPEGGSLYETVARALGEVGRAFSAARVVQEARRGHVPPGLAERAAQPLPFTRWTRIERRLGPPLLVRVQGSDLRAAALAEFLDGRQKIVLLVEGECAPAPLARLIAPGTFVLQGVDAAGLKPLAGYEGPGIAALVPESAARFVHDPGAPPRERLKVEAIPDRVPRRAIGGASGAQQAEELELLRTLAERASAGAEKSNGAGPEGGRAAEPADKLATWLLSQVDLSDLG